MIGILLVSSWASWFAVGAPPRVLYDADHRVAHVRSALWAVRSTSPRDREHARAYMTAMERGACSSSSERLRVECLMTAARRYCRGKRAARDTCLRVLDVAMSNALNERSIISTSRRYELMQQGGSVRTALRQEADRIHAGWVVDFHLAHGGPDGCGAGDDECTAAAIDAFCLRAGDAYDQSWQACVGALVWAMGGSDEAAPPEAESPPVAGGEP